MSSFPVKPTCPGFIHLFPAHFCSIKHKSLQQAYIIFRFKLAPASQRSTINNKPFPRILQLRLHRPTNHPRKRSRLPKIPSPLPRSHRRLLHHHHNHALQPPHLLPPLRLPRRSPSNGTSRRRTSNQSRMRQTRRQHGYKFLFELLY